MDMSNHFQVAYVTRNLDKAIDLVTKHYQCKDFVLFEPNIEMVTAQGTGPVHTKVALCWSGNLMVELIQPIGGLIDLYMGVLPKDDTSLGFHHICMRTDEFDKTRAEIGKLGWKVALEGEVPGCKYVYIDRRATLGHYVEYLWASPEMWAYMGWRS